MADINKEMEDILNENPMEEIKLKPQKFKKKLKLPKKKTILVLGVILIIIIGSFLLIPDLCDKCICEVGSTNADFINSIKQQIIEKGYAEIKDGDSIIKLAPYID